MKIYYKVRNGAEIEWELTTDTDKDAKPLNNLPKAGVGYVQLKKKIEDFRGLVAGNLQSTSEFHRKAIAKLLYEIEAHEKTLAGLLQKVESFQVKDLDSIAKSIRDWE